MASAPSSMERFSCLIRQVLYAGRSNTTYLQQSQDSRNEYDAELASNKAACDIHSIIHSFLDDRLKEKKRHYHSAVQLSLFCFFWCMLFYFAYIWYPTPSLYFISTVLYAMGTITITICPLDELDLDEFCSAHPRIRTILCLVLSGYDVVVGMYRFPHVKCLAAIPILWIMFGGPRVHVKHNPRATTLYSVSMMLELIAVGLHDLMQALSSEATATSNLVVYKTRVSALTGAALCLCGSLFLTAHWFRPRPMARRYPTLRTIEIFYGIEVCLGAMQMIQNIPCSDLCRSVPTNCLWSMAFGFVAVLPPCINLIFGRAAIYGFMTRRFDRNHAKKDGTFLAELYMMHDSSSVGDLFWVEKETLYLMDDKDPSTLVVCQELASIANEDGSSCDWIEGVITGISPAGNIRVKLRNFPRYCFTFTQTATPNTVDQVLKNNEVRCVEWESLPFLLMQTYKSSVGDSFNLSRPLGKDEHIDFFVSHSWRDDFSLKWSKLADLAESFKLQRGRYPTFWIDKFCLRHRDGDPTGALKSLTMYILACDRMVVLCGTTFPSRLWCAWEIFTLCAFQHKDQAMSRIHPILLGQDKGSGELENLKKFNVANTSCYSPFDERRIMTIIDSVGRNDFNEKVRNLFELMIKRT